MGDFTMFSDQLDLWNRFLGHYLPVLRAALRPPWIGTDPHTLEECIDDALLELCAHSEAWDPDRGSLTQYVLRTARGRVANKLRGCRRRQQRERCVGVFDHEFRKFLNFHGVKTARADFIPREDDE